MQDARCRITLVQDSVSASDQGRRLGTADGVGKQVSVPVFSDSTLIGWCNEFLSVFRVEQTPGHGADLIEGVHRISGA